MLIYQIDSDEFLFCYLSNVKEVRIQFNNFKWNKNMYNICVHMQNTFD